MAVQSNVFNIATDRLSFLDDLQNADKIFREAALDTVVLISDRVQNSGKKANGQSFDKSKGKHIGVYSKSYGNKRVKNGRQVKIIDLTYTSDMMDGLTAEPDGKRSYIVGFRGEKASQKAEWNEDRYGEIFELSNSESELIFKVINRRIDELSR